MHSYGVCDDEDYFYDYIDGLYKGLGAGPHLAGKSARDLFRAVQAKGAGYAIAQDEELTIIKVTLELIPCVMVILYLTNTIRQTWLHL